jgi:ribosomal-protein-alanine N-acetyltransferase
MTLTIAPMREEDLDDVVRIEHATFKFPWSRKFFATDMSKPQALMLVVRGDNTVIGYCVAWHIADELHLANIAIDAGFRTQGIGTRLLEELLKLSQEAGVKAVYLEVRLSNTSAQRFYLRHGFRHSYTRKGYYPDGEDAMIFERQLPAGPRAG